MTAIRVETGARAMQLHDSDDVGGQAALSDAAARRLSNQLARAFRGTYGADTGLRTVVQSVARQMLVAGASRAAVARTLERVVLEHPARLAVGPRNVLTEEPHSRLLVALTRECVDEVFLELSSG